jgi:light-regulated signal transduction histidine kinase (bacteriophytochrome)
VGPHGPRLTPRASFELFVESVRGRSLPWLPVELNAAARLRVLVMELVIGRAEQLAELNADLARSNEELDAFAHVASHDLKEPLRAIHKYAHQLLEEAVVGDQEQRRKLESVMRLTLRMDSLLDSLLHFSRVGRVALEFELTDLNEVVADAIEMVGSRTADGAVEIVVPRPLPRVPCDPVRVREIFVNLLSNALKYNGKANKRVEVGYIAAGEDHPRPRAPSGANARTVFFVKDDGIGISDKHFEHIFQMFRRLHARTEYGGGTGAGLSIVKKLVERHRGQVWLNSEPGNGSTFYFTLQSHD